MNITGALLLGVLVGVDAGDDVMRLAGTGLLGAYTTFSTWMLDSRRLRERGRTAAAALNLAGSLALGPGAIWLGRWLGGAP